MAHDILNTMRGLREDMRQRLMQVPEYRALVALDRSIEEIGAILQAGIISANVAPQPVAPEPPPQPARQSGIASAFAETLAAKLDQRNNARAASYLPTHRVAEN